MWLPSSSCASKGRTINVQTFQLSFHTCLSVCLWLSNKQAMWAQRCRLCGQSRGEQTAVGSEWLTVWRLFFSSEQHNFNGICRNALGQSCRKMEMSRERKKMMPKQEAWTYEARKRSQRSWPVPGTAAGLWHTQGWYICFNERKEGGLAAKEWWRKMSKFRKMRWKRWKELHFSSNRIE